jgi:flagellum-specific ATP synthase
MWSAYQQNKDLVQVGAYQAGSNSDLDLALRMKDQISAFLLQDMHEACGLDDSMRLLESLLGGE